MASILLGALSYIILLLLAKYVIFRGCDEVGRLVNIVTTTVLFATGTYCAIVYWYLKLGGTLI